MTDAAQEILAHYAWSSGDCFRCARTELPTAKLSRIDTPAGTTYEVRCCQACVLDLEEARRQDAERGKREYEPGRLGGPADSGENVGSDLHWGASGES